MTSYVATIDKNIYAACITPAERGVILRLQYTNTAGKTKTIAGKKFKTEYNAMMCLKRRYHSVIWNLVK